MERKERKTTEKRAMLKYAIRAGMFLLVISVVLSGLTNMLRLKSGDSHLLLSRELQQRTEWDVIFAGCSRTNQSVYPMQLWRDYGFTSYNNAQSGETVPLSYWTCKSIIRRCHPKVLVLDVAYCYLDQTYGNTSWMHQSLDPLSAWDRIPAAMDLAPEEEKMDFVFPLSIYHTRWKELTASDFEDRSTLLKGCSQTYKIAEDIAGMELGELPEKEMLAPSDVALEYLDKIVELCKETGTQLVLVFPPAFTFPEIETISTTHDMTLEPLYANWLAEYTAEKNVDYINFYKLVDELGFDYFLHLYNYSHMNYWGGEIVTDYLGRYLAENYDLPDRRGDPAYEQWNEELLAYEVRVDRQLQNSSYTAIVDSTKVAEIVLERIDEINELPVKTMITREEYGDWVANQGVWIDRCNGVAPEVQTELHIPRDAKEINLYGWALDFWNDAPMQELYLQVGDESIKCEFTVERETVAERFGNDAVNCGFNITFPISLLQGGDVEKIYFIGVSADGQYVYAPAAYQIDIS